MWARARARARVGVGVGVRVRVRVRVRVSTYVCPRGGAYLLELAQQPLLLRRVVRGRGMGKG